MSAVDWNRLEEARAGSARATLWRHAAPLALGMGAAFLAWLPADAESTRPAWAALTAALALTFAVIDAPSARRAFIARHQREVLPALFAHAGVELRAAPYADPPWVVCDRTGLFPATAEKARPTRVFHGSVDGVPLEACAFVLTRQRIKRKVRKIDVPVFDGAIFAADLGLGRDGGALWLGRRARWAPRKAWAQLWRRRGSGVWGGRVYAARHASWSADADAAIKAFLSAYPRAALSLADGRHLVAVLPGAGAIFRPSWPWVGVGHDRRGARAVEMARALARVARALGVQDPKAVPPVGDPSATPQDASNPFATGGPSVATAGPVSGVLPGHTLSKAPDGDASMPLPADRPSAALGWGATFAASAAALGAAVRGSAFAQRLEQAGWDKWDALRGRMGMDVPEPTMTVRAVGPVSQSAPATGLRKEPVLSAAKPADVAPTLAEPMVSEASPVVAMADASPVVETVAGGVHAPAPDAAGDASWSDADTESASQPEISKASDPGTGVGPSPFGPPRSS